MKTQTYSGGKMSEYSFKHFWIKKTGTLLSVVVPAMFFFVYFIPVSSLLSGRDSFDLVMQLHDVLPLHAFKEIVFFLLFAGYSVNAITLLYSIFSAGGWFSNLDSTTYFLRGVSAVSAIPFIAHFFFSMRLPYIFTTSTLTYSKFSGVYAHGLMNFFFCAGVMATAFTFFSSIAFFAYESGILVSRKSRRAATVLVWCAFVISMLWCLRVSVAF